jgi:hypothetical protein
VLELELVLVLRLFGWVRTCARAEGWGGGGQYNCSWCWFPPSVLHAFFALRKPEGQAFPCSLINFDGRSCV